MKSIGVRLTLWYALTSTLTLAILFVAGYFLLERHLIEGLDLLNASEFKQIKARLGPDYQTLSPETMNGRIRETTDYASTLFYIYIHRPKVGVIFHSTNLAGQEMPDVPGKHDFNGTIPGIGELRIAEFILPPFDVNIATPLGPVRTVMEGYVEVCFALLGAMLVVSAITGFWLAQIVLRPVRMIRETALRIGSDNLSQRIPVGDVKDEISNLSRLLNEMFDRIEASFEQIRRFTGEASHELKTPISLVRLHAEKMIVDPDFPAAHKEAVQVQLEELGRLNSIIDELLFIARADARAIRMDLQQQEVGAFLQGFAQDAQVLAEHFGCHFVLQNEVPGTAAFEPKWIRQVLLNLLTNALKASPRGAEIRLRSEAGHDAWRLSMEDQGCGLTAEQRERMFDRFVRFSAPGNEQGTGLGLAICRSIVDLHRGRIYSESGEGGKGLKVVVEIPRAAPGGL
jgi:two-component system heavy metal sensor histidine kinase CusS